MNSKEVSVSNGRVRSRVQGRAGGDENSAVDEEGECEETDRQLDDGHFHAVVYGWEGRIICFFVRGRPVETGGAVRWLGCNAVLKVVCPETGLNDATS